MSESKAKLLCYNKGCCQTFDPENNDADSCVFHPGTPVFHDAYKSWSCCNKKTTDFTEFLNFKGCTKSFHSNVKPVEPEKPKSEQLGRDEVIVYEAPKPMAEHIRLTTRPSEDEPMVRLNATVTQSLTDLLKRAATEKASKTQSDAVSNEVHIGTSCKNGGCKRSYEGEASNTELCTYHPGVPIFHEGLKFWSCCKKRTTDFETFLEQAGCTTGSHVWHKSKGELKRIESRYDFHQTGSHVVLSIYAKGCDPSRCYVEANAVKLHVYAAYSDAIFDEHFVLQGVIDVTSSVVTLAATKMEVTMKKAVPMSWTKLTGP